MHHLFSSAKILICGTVLAGVLIAPAHAVVFQAEDYNAAFDSTTGNTGGAYRRDNVDIEATRDAGAGYNIGWIDAKEWWAYNNLVVPSTGSYQIRFARR